MYDLEKALDLIDEYGGDFEGKKDITLINKAEKLLDLRFPPTYRKFIETLGCGDIEGLEFYGLIDDDFENSGIPNAIWLTFNERKSGLPKNLVLIYSDGNGTYYAIDTDQVDSNGENPIVAYGIGGSIKKVSNNFGSFLLEELQTVLGGVDRD